MKAWNVILFFLCLNCSGIIVAQMVKADVLTLGESGEMPYNTTDIENAFSLSAFSVSNIGFGLIGAGLGGIVAVITKQYMFASAIILIWLVGSFLGVITWFTNGFPKMIGLLLYGTGLDFIQYVISAIMTAFFFMFLAGLLSQRDLTQ